MSLVDTELIKFELQVVSDYRRRLSTAQNKIVENFVFVLLKFNKYIFISSVMQIKFQAVFDLPYPADNRNSPVLWFYL